MQDDRKNLDNKILMSAKKNPSSSEHPENINKGTKHPENINKGNKENISPYI